MSDSKPEPKAYAVETIDGSTKLFNDDELEAAQHMFACRGTSMFTLYMHPVEQTPLTESEISTVTVPENKLTELQIVASQRDELLEAIINSLPNLHTGDELPMSYYADKKGVLGGALRAIAKAKGEQQ
jgi:hypothetical protein